MKHYVIHGSTISLTPHQDAVLNRLFENYDEGDIVAATENDIDYDESAIGQTIFDDYDLLAERIEGDRLFRLNPGAWLRDYQSKRMN